jgi:predicted acylesterase/phospholipase RssA
MASSDKHEKHSKGDYVEDEQGHVSAAFSDCEDADPRQSKRREEDIREAEAGAKQTPYDTLCFSGGGTNGIAFIGTLRELFLRREVDWVCENRVVKHFIGTSVGALVATLVYCRIDLFSKEIVQLVTDFCSYAGQTPMSLLKSGFGLSDGDHCIQFLRRALKRQFNKPNLTFIELRHIVGGTLTLVASDLKTAEPVYISFETHPHEEVAKACFASMCLPGMFKWQTLNKKVCSEWLPDAVVSRHVSTVQYRKANKLGDFIGERFVMDGKECEILAYNRRAGTWLVDVYEAQHVLDGCFTDNNPFSAAKPGAKVLNLVVAKSREFEPNKNGLGKYAMRVLSLSMRRVEKLMEDIHSSVKRDCIVVDTKKAGIRSRTHVNKADFSRLVQDGKVAANEFFVRKYGKKVRRQKTREKTSKNDRNEVQTQTGTGASKCATPRVIHVGKWENARMGEKNVTGEIKPVRMSELNQKWTKMPSSGKAMMRAWTILDPRFDQWRKNAEERWNEEEEEGEGEEEELANEFIDQFETDR